MNTSLNIPHVLAEGVSADHLVERAALATLLNHQASMDLICTLYGVVADQVALCLEMWDFTPSLGDLSFLDAHDCYWPDELAGNPF